MIDLDGLVLAPCFAAFGESVVYLRAGGAPTTLTGVWDEKYATTAFEADGAQVVTQRPSIALRVAEIGYGLPVQSELFEIRGRLYRVSDPPHVDGQGHVRAPLQLATDADALTPPAPPVPPPAPLAA